MFSLIFFTILLVSSATAEPKERCGCAREVFAADPSLKSCADGTKKFCGDCGGGTYGCANGACPFPGAYRDGK